MTWSRQKKFKVTGTAVCVVLVVALSAQTQRAIQPSKAAPIAPIPSAIASIRAADLRGNLSFLSSDALAGRFTPSPGLDVAAEFIASQFRAAGLEPGGDQEYFQMAKMVDRDMPKVTRDMMLNDGSHSSNVPAASISIANVKAAVQLEKCPVIVVAKRDPQLLKDASLAGKTVVAPALNLSEVPSAERDAFIRKSGAFDRMVLAAGAKMELLVGRSRRRPGKALFAEGNNPGDDLPIVVAENDELHKWIKSPTSGTDERRTVTFSIPAADDRPVILKNVVGILRGSDATLKSTCVMVTAHYDHIGTLETGASLSPQPPDKNSKDQIFNGANDDGSGTVSVIEIAKALSKLPVHPKRSIVFVTFFGEERGDIGSGYYGRHPVFPIAKTVADINLEQVGRTDSTNGKQLSNASVTGFDYSDVTKFLQDAGRRVGVTIYLDKEGSDAYFERSDNAALAQQGVPAHTLCVAFDYPDYHGLADEWQKINYDNMAKVDRAVALGVLNIANSLRAPQWNATNPKTKGFREAQARSKQPTL